MITKKITRLVFTGIWDGESRICKYYLLGILFWQFTVIANDSILVRKDLKYHR